MKELKQSKLNELIDQCREQTALYAQRETYDQSYCFEIWRRAVVDRDETAWTAVIDQYSVFVRRWLVQRLASHPALRFEEDALVNGVFFNFFRFVGAEKFGNFNNLPAILQYLKMCCGTLVIDAQRDQQARQLDTSLDAATAIDGSSDTPLNPASRLSSEFDLESAVLDQADRPTFWNAIWQKLPDQNDRLLVYLRYVLDMPPREIIQKYPQHFADINEVYRRNKNILWRLRNTSLQES